MFRDYWNIFANDVSQNGDIYVTMVVITTMLSMAIYWWARTWTQQLLKKRLRVSHRDRYLQEWLEDRVVYCIEGGLKKKEITQQDSKYLYRRMVRALDMVGVSVHNSHQKKEDIKKRISAMDRRPVGGDKLNGKKPHRRPVRTMLVRKGVAM